ncbi:MAG: hypothetical protein QOK11_306 [Pseudonocardiales bacterium]|nr:hypothetical protein [Pseudonocardiales bacterium]
MATTVSHVTASDGPDADLVAHWRVVVDTVIGTQHRLMETIEASGIPAQWFAVLSMLLNAPEQRMPMTQLARQVSITSGGFTKLADRMGRDGLIDRRSSAGDRRVVYATLTAAGRTAAQRAEEQYLAALHKHVLGALPVSQLVELSQALAALDAHHATADADDPDDVADDAAVVSGRDPALPERRAERRGSAADRKPQ